MRKRNFFTNYRKDGSGAAAIMLALAIVPIVLAAGGAVDMINTINMKVRLQGALDAGALAAAAARKLNDGDRRQAALDTFRKNFAKGSFEKPGVTPTVKIGDDTVTMTATVKNPTAFLKLVGIDTLDVAVKSVVRRHYGSLEVALVLDNTGSMAGSKLTTLKQASRNLVNTLFDEGAKEKIRISLVPFAQYVNVGKKWRNASWLDVPPDRDINHPSSCRWKWSYKPINCRRTTCTRWRDGTRHTYSCRKCNWIKDRYVYKCSPGWTERLRWKGCVGSRDYPLNVQDKSPGSRIPGLLNARCPRPILPLTADKSMIDREINRMSASGYTYIPSGLIWGWRLISDGVPFTEGVGYEEAKKKNVTKAIVLMTDGKNTRSPSYPRHDNRDTNQANRLTSELCANVKAAGIRIYSVTFEVSDPGIKRLLKRCASDAASYFDAKDNAALLAAFKDIGKSLAMIYLSE